MSICLINSLKKTLCCKHYGKDLLFDLKIEAIDFVNGFFKVAITEIVF